MSGRRPFTSDDDRLLAKYIAKYCPTPKGRSGNTLYRNLCEDPDNKWKWGQRHTWQSWRDRYCKRQETFDARIGKYMSKHGISSEKTERSGQHNTNNHVASQGGNEEPPRKKRKQEGVEPSLQVESNRAPIQEEGLQGDKRDTNDTQKEEPNIDQSMDSKNNARREPSLERVVPDITSEKPQTSQPNFVGTIEDRVIEERERPIAETIKSQSDQPLYPDITTLPIPQIQLDPHLVNTIPQGTTAYENSTPHHESPALPVASTSKVQLSPTHSAPLTPATTPPVSHSNRTPDEDLFSEITFEDSPSGHRQTPRPKRRMPTLIQGPYGNYRYIGRKKRYIDSDTSDSDHKLHHPNLQTKMPLDKGKGRAVNESPTTLKRRSSAMDHSGTVPTASGNSAVGSQFVEADPKSTSRIQAPHTKRRQVAPFPQLSQSSKAHLSRGIMNTGFRKSWSSATVPDENSGDPFLVQPSFSGSKLKRIHAESSLSRRHTIGTTHENKHPGGRHIDLRAVVVKRLPAESSSFRSVSYNVSPDILNHSGVFSRLTPLGSDRPSEPDPARRRSSFLSIPVAEEDREQVEYLGVARALEMIGANFRFRDEDVWRVYEQLQSISRTEDFCRRYWEKASALQDEVFDDMERDSFDLDALPDGNGTSAPTSSHPSPDPDNRMYQKRNHSHGTKTSTSRNNKPSSGQRLRKSEFKFRPLPLERALSEYTPPSASRAGQYARLVKQGRQKEALSREKRRASGGIKMFSSLRGSSAAQETPEPNRPASKSPGKNEKARVLQSTVQDRPSEPVKAVKADNVLQEEEERMILSATSAMAPELSSIEQRVGVDYMRRWTAKQLAKLKEEADNSILSRG